MAKSGKVPYFMSDRFVEFIGCEFQVWWRRTGRVHPVLKFSIEHNGGAQQISLGGVDSTPGVEADYFRWQPQAGDQAAIGVKDHGTLRPRFTRTHDSVELLGRLEITSRVTLRGQQGPRVGE